MLIYSKALLVSNDMDGRHHSATTVLLHHFNTQMSLHKLWVAMGRVASTSTAHFTNGAAVF